MHAGVQFFAGWGIGRREGNGRFLSTNQDSEGYEDEPDDSGLRDLKKTIMLLAQGTNTGMDYYKNLPLCDLNEDIKLYSEIEEQKLAAAKEAQANR